MTGATARALSQDPGWWYESWDPADWLGTLFNQPVEVHAFLLGAVIGILLASLSTSRHPRTALTLALLVVLFAFGSLETVVGCSAEFTACRHLRGKPWYFLGGYLVTHLGALAALGRASGYDATTDDADATTASPLAGLIVAALVGLALYSFVSPSPVHPITGLAAVGGLLGSALGLAACEWVLADDGAGRTFAATTRRVLLEETDESVLVVAYGTVVGFGYPRAIWEVGRFVGRDGFPFGQIVWAQNGIPSVVAYVVPFFLAGLAIVRRRLGQLGAARLGGRRFAAIVLGYVAYTACLIAMIGFAGHVWFRVVPAAD